MAKREGLSILSRMQALDKLHFIKKAIGAGEEILDNYKLYHEVIATKLGIAKSNIVVNITKLTKPEGGKITLINLINLNGGKVLYGGKLSEKDKQEIRFIQKSKG